MDVRLGQEFSQVVPVYVNVDPTDPTTFRTEQVAEGKFVLKPGDMVLSSLVEIVGLPNDISAKLLGCSSLGRLGLDNSSCSGWIDPGFSGSICIELFNHSRSPMVLTSGMRIGQIIFFKHVKCQEDYSKRKGSKYMNQQGVQGSRGV